MGTQFHGEYHLCLCAYAHAADESAADRKDGDNDFQKSFWALCYFDFVINKLFLKSLFIHINLLFL